MASDPVGAFKAHANYLRAFNTLMESYYVPGKFMVSTDRLLEAVSKKVTASRLYDQLNARPTGNGEQGLVKNILRNAWGTEFLLASAGDFFSDHDELIRIANNWAVVQAYYASYHVTQALLVARGQPRPSTHAVTQTQYGAFWCRPRVQLPPWSLGLDASGLCNLPPGLTFKPVDHHWEACTPDTCWGLVAFALKGTRKDWVTKRQKEERERKRADAKKAWRKQQRAREETGKHPLQERVSRLPRLEPGEKTAIDLKLRPATLLDYLWRLRCRSNYEDVDMFTEGPEDEIQSSLVHLNLCRITAATLLVNELLIARLIGATTLRTIADEWVSSTGTATAKVGVARRLGIFAGL